MPLSESSFAGDRLAKVIARAGLCSRRDAELWIKDGRVAVNGKVIRTPAFNVTETDKVKVDGQPLQARQGTRVWLYHKPQGLVVTEKDPEGRPTVFETLEEQGLPRVVSIGRLDLTTEGLLLLTNDGELARFLELPATGWTRRYRVRVFGEVDEKQLAALEKGPTIEGVKYGPIEAVLDRIQGRNAWLTVSLKEGKNREIRKVMESLGLQVNRLIRVAYGPFQLGKLEEGAVEEVPKRVVREQIAPFFGTPEGAEPAESGTKQRAKARAEAVKAAPAKGAPANADARATPKRAPRSATKRHEAEAARTEEAKPARRGGSRGTLSLGGVSAKPGRPGKADGARSDSPRSEGARSRDDRPRDGNAPGFKPGGPKPSGPKGAGPAPRGGPKAGGERSGGDRSGGGAGRTERPRADRRR